MVPEVPQVPLSQDAALIIGLVGTALPFSHSAEDEAERWLRAMRLHGEVGNALQALGVGEAPLMTGSEPPGEQVPGSPTLGGAVLDRITARACAYALQRDAETVGTVEVLFAVLEVYGRLFERALYLRGTSRDELIDRLSAGDRAPESNSAS